MAMTPFEKAIIAELKGIKNELHELNKKKPDPGQVDGKEITLKVEDLEKAASPWVIVHQREL